MAPGGPGTDDAIIDAEWVDFTRRQGWPPGMFGICTGSLLLGAAGLLRGRRASSHWRARELLSRFGAIPSDERMCVDGHIYGGRRHLGIDMGLRVVADLCGEDVAKLIQLQVERPRAAVPRRHAETSDPAIVQRYLAQSQARFESRSARWRAAAAMPG